ncbi:MAG: histidine phosphatase family protein [Chloroflexi bacterium]|nr:histidine phosphatase family protein [Chloroflexota bacterium]
MLRLFLVRHGAIPDVEAGRYWGHTDIPLSQHGIRQAEMLRQRLASENIAAVYSSDLSRAHKTASIIAGPHDVPVTLCHDLREIDFGQLEGTTFDEAQRNRPGVENLWFGTDPGTGFPGGESLDALAGRVDSAIERILEAGSPDISVLLVAHGGPIRVLVCRMMGMDVSRWWQIRIDLASLSVLEVYPEGSVVSILNDVCHLGGAI